MGLEQLEDRRMLTASISDYSVWGDTSVNLDRSDVKSGLVGSGGNITSSNAAQAEGGDGIRAGGNFTGSRAFKLYNDGDIFANGNVTVSVVSACVGVDEVHAGGVITDVTNCVDNAKEFPGESTPVFTPPTLPDPIADFSSLPGANKVVSNPGLALSPGTYGDVTFTANHAGPLSLKSGTYVLNSLSLGNSGQIHIDLSDSPNQISVFVKNNFNISRGDVSLTGPGSAADVYWEIHGDMIGNVAPTIVGTVYVPDGDIILNGNDTSVTGALYAGAVGGSGQVLFGNSTTVNFVPASFGPFGPPAGEKDPGFSYVDVNNDGLYLASDGDVALTAGEVADGLFDTDVAEGVYSSVVQGAGLYISSGEGAISKPRIDYRSDGDLRVNTNLDGTSKLYEGRLVSREGSILLDDPIVEAEFKFFLTAAVDIIATAGDTIGVDRSDGYLELSAGRDVDLTDSTIVATRTTVIIARGSIKATGATIENQYPAGSLMITANGGDIDVTDAKVDAGRTLGMLASGAIQAANAILDNAYANGSIQISANGGAINLTDATVDPGRTLIAEAVDDIMASGAFIEALGSSGNVTFIGKNINLDHSTVRAERRIRFFASQNLSAKDALIETTSASSHPSVEFYAGDDIDVSGCTIKSDAVTGKIILEAGSDLDDDLDLTTATLIASTIITSAGGAITP